MTRGRFNASTGSFETIRDPDYHMIWIVHQLIHGVASGDAYTGWQCDVKCEECDRDHGTCQYDGTRKQSPFHTQIPNYHPITTRLLTNHPTSTGTCECAEGWHGPACDRRCDCYRHVAVKNALELRDQTEDVMLESVESHSGFPIQPVSSVPSQSPFRTQTPNYKHPITTRLLTEHHHSVTTTQHGTCQRDGTCRCYADPDGTEWTGKDCFTRCKPCSHGRCGSDGECQCDLGWTGDQCDTPRYARQTVSLPYSNTQSPPNY